MGLNYRDLDDRTRAYMVEEINRDSQAGTLYLSNYLTQRGREDWPGLLRAAASAGTDDTFADELRRLQRLKVEVERRKPKGGYTTARVPATAAQTMAEGEFNRMYIRAICRRAIDDGVGRVVVYRAKAVENPRPESEQKVGASFDAPTVLNDIRQNPGNETWLGVPPGPNTGLTVRLP
jgi:hypothetical protein